jgi:hypothetical protein
MHKYILGWFAAAALVVLASSTARAESKHWHEVGEYHADGKDAIEVQVDRPSVTFIRIVCTDGSVIINTLVVREGNEKTPHTIGKRLEKGDEETLDIGESKATGFRISHDGRGTYTVYVK